MTPRLDLQLDRSSVEPGGPVSGRVRVVEGGKSRRLLISVDYRERTAHYSAVARTVTGPVLHEGDLVAGAVYEFTVQLPADALPGYRSSHGRLSWELEVRSDEFGIDTVERRELEVATTPPDDDMWPPP